MNTDLIDHSSNRNPLSAKTAVIFRSRRHQFAGLDGHCAGDFGHALLRSRLHHQAFCSEVPCTKIRIYHRVRNIIDHQLDFGHFRPSRPVDPASVPSPAGK